MPLPLPTTVQSALAEAAAPFADGAQAPETPTPLFEVIAQTAADQAALREQVRTIGVALASAAGVPEGSTGDDRRGIDRAGRRARRACTGRVNGRRPQPLALVLSPPHRPHLYRRHDRLAPR